ncbi:MAG: nucleotide exchange factor GrpE [Candidatus Woesearchaeota archaeon]
MANNSDIARKDRNKVSSEGLARPKSTEEKEKTTIESTSQPPQHKSVLDSEINELKQQIEKLNSENVELKGLLQRMQAEFDNYRKRTEKEKLVCKQQSCREIIQRFLPVLDSIDNAEKHTKDEGLLAIAQQFRKVLESFGLRQIDAEGKRFDPYYHEALLLEDGNEDDVVKEVLQKGYLLNCDVIRHAKVKVTRKKKEGGYGDGAVNPSDKEHS